MIDAGDGRITILANDTAIHRQMTIGELTTTKLYKEYLKEVRDMKTGYVWYDFVSQKIGESKIAVALCMKNGVLYSVYFGLHDNEKNYESWEHWTLEREIKLKEQQDHFLKQLFNRQPDVNTQSPYPLTEYHFPWGSVWSVYDPRSGSASIGLRYNIATT